MRGGWMSSEKISSLVSWKNPFWLANQNYCLTLLIANRRDIVRQQTVSPLSAHGVLFSFPQRCHAIFASRKGGWYRKRLFDKLSTTQTAVDVPPTTSNTWRLILSCSPHSPSSIPQLFRPPVDFNPNRTECFLFGGSLLERHLRVSPGNYVMVITRQYHPP